MLLDTISPIVDRLPLADEDTAPELDPDARAMGVDLVLCVDEDMDDRAVDLLEWRLSTVTDTTIFELADLRPVHGGLRARFLRRSLRRTIADQDVCDLLMRVGRVRPWVGLTKVTSLTEAPRCQ